MGKGKKGKKSDSDSDSESGSDSNSDSGKKKDKKDKKDKKEKKEKKEKLSDEEKRRKKEEKKRRKEEKKRLKKQYKKTKVNGQKKFFFNPYKVSDWKNSQNFEQSVLPVNDFDQQTFVELRNHSTEESALGQLLELGVNLDTVDVKSFSMNISRVCFICCNTYTREGYKLGVGPLNDSITVAANHKMMGYFVYFLHNPTSVKYLQFLKLFLEKTQEYLTVYYTGHGSNIKDQSGGDDEDDGFDEVMIFDDTYIVDDKLTEILKNYANKKAKTILINDCCHSGTIWDIPDPLNAQDYPPNVICLSAADDNETAKQGRQGNNDQGFFTFFLFQEVRRNRAITPIDIRDRVSSQLENYHQCVVVSPTREELMKQPLFPQ